MFEDFMEKHEATDRAVFIKPLDSLNKSDYKKLVPDVDDVITTLQRETEAKTQIELDSIKKFQDFLSSPNNISSKCKRQLTSLPKLKSNSKRLKRNSKHLRLKQRDCSLTSTTR